MTACTYNLTECPAWVSIAGKNIDQFDALKAENKGALWGNALPPPAIGQRVRVNFNQFGAGEVVGYFLEHGFLGVQVRLDKRPAWHVKQNGPQPHIHVFGLEIDIPSITFTLV